jgi:hypothetical protein
MSNSNFNVEEVPGKDCAFRRQPRHKMQEQNATMHSLQGGGPDNYGNLPSQIAHVFRVAVKVIIDFQKALLPPSW